jgi:hypothetical protein
MYAVDFDNEYRNPAVAKPHYMISASFEVTRMRRGICRRDAGSPVWQETIRYRLVWPTLVT